MLCYPNAKINLGLKIISKRDDGFHNLDSLFVPIPLFDILEVKKQLLPIKDTTITYSGLNCNTIDNDLVIAAYNMLNSDFSLPPIRVHLHKIIPFGSGLGGGSSDGAFMLMTLNRLFNLDLNQAQLLDYANRLGSDCPFFIINQFSHVSNTGDVVRPINFSFNGYYIVVLKPEIHCSTKNIFSRYQMGKQDSSLIQFDQNILSWKKELVNDLELITFSLYPELKQLKNYLYDQGAIYASMSGSGSSIYGIFNHQPEIDKNITYWTWEGFFR